MALGSKRGGAMMKGSRLGVTPSGWQHEGVELADRAGHEYQCPAGHAFVVTMAAQVEVPGTWSCPKCGHDATLTEGYTAVIPGGKYIGPSKTEFEQLLQRRTREEGEEIIERALERMRRLQAGGTAAQAS